MTPLSEMLPRKRPRPNPTRASTNLSSTPAPQPATNTSSASDPTAVTHPLDMPPPSTPKQSEQDPPSSLPKGIKQVHKTRSWYGSWPRVPKSSPSTQVARENILGGTSKPSNSPDLSRFDPKKSPAASISRSSSRTSLARSIRPAINTEETTRLSTQECSQRTVDQDAATRETEVPAGTEHETQEVGPGDNAEGSEDTKMGEAAPIPIPSNASTVVDEGSPEVDNKDAKDTNAAQPLLGSTPQRPTTSSGWLTWFGRSPAPPPLDLQATDCDAETTKPDDSDTTKAPEEPTAPEQQEEAQHEHREEEDSTEQPNEPETRTEPIVPDPAPDPAPQGPSGRSSWFGFWSSDVTVPQAPPLDAVEPVEPVAERAEPEPERSEDIDMQDAPPPQPQPEPVKTPSAGSTWAFWSRDTRSKASGSSKQQSEPGELAIIGEGSESHPQPVSSSDVNTPGAKDGKADDKPPATPVSARRKSNKRTRPQSMDIDTQLNTPPKAGQKQDKPVKPSQQEAPVKVVPTPETPKKPATPAKESSSSTLSPNLLLPSFTSTYRMKENPSILKQIADFLLRTNQPPANHVYLTKEPPKIKKALSIGVHGLFPAYYLKPLIGQPTGTSLRFASLGAEAIRRWAERNGQSECEIEKVALEGEGKIADRVNNLWTLLLNWIDQIRNADLIILACHSQGVPVSIILLAKLIDLGIIKNAKIGVCAMAGVSLGPFPSYKSGMGMLMDTAAELWQFGNPESEVSQRYATALKEVLEYGARITFIGSIDDQLVPMESAVCSPANHPYIYRAAFIDGRVHAPDFIAHLVGFALKLRNLGVSDHGLIRELSMPLAGSLYSGEGHSRLYWDDQVYDLAVSHALETEDVPCSVPCRVHKHEGLSSSNPYHLPWVMRGLLEEDFVKTELLAETDELLRQFDAWKPTTKALKDVKYRLEAVKSRL